MSREIKFRAWDKKGKRMFSGVDVSWLYARIDGDRWSLWQDVGEKTEKCVLNYKDGVLMQYTGLKDKNGKEIYEGDIVEIESNGDKYVKVVKFHTEAEYGRSCFGADIIGWHTKDARVIGNIYESLERLKKELN